MLRPQRNWPLSSAAHGRDFGALAAVLRGDGAASSVGASLEVSPVVSDAVARGVTMSPLPAAPLVSGSAGPSMSTIGKASSSASGGAVGALSLIHI